MFDKYSEERGGFFAYLFFPNASEYVATPVKINAINPPTARRLCGVWDDVLMYDVLIAIQFDVKQ